MIREWQAAYMQIEDLINIGAYVRGSNPTTDTAVAVQERIKEFLRQGIDERVSFDQTVGIMHSIVRAAEAVASGGQDQQQ